MKQTAYALLGLAALFSAGTTLAAGDAAAGKAKSMACASCHGADGIATIPNYPSLAGQNEGYLVSSLKDYKNKQRTGAFATIMSMQAVNLSDADIENLAAYYAGLK